ncbi:MAG: hypothetical protein GTO41_06620 [Burkholderiales bacterium]|nr:hypothetical protein [Burkholderiales bacterium]
MNKFIAKSGKVTPIPVRLLLVALVLSSQSLAEGEQATSATFEETHALIANMIVDKLILQNHWHKSDFPQYNHFDDAKWSVTLYSGDECEVTYRRKYEISHKAEENVKEIIGDRPAIIVGYKTAKFDMAQIDTIDIHDYGNSRGSIPSIGIRFVGPTKEWRTIGEEPDQADLQKDPIIETDNAISVFAKDAGRILKAFQHLRELCQAVDDKSS